MHVILLRQWRALRAGQRADIPDGAAGVLVRRGIAAPAAAETGARPRPADSPEPQPRRRKR